MNSRTSVSGTKSYNGYLATRSAVIGLARVLFLGLCQISAVAAAPLGITPPTKAWKGHEHWHDEVDGVNLWLNLSIAVILVLLGGAFAGLTIALMGQDGVYLQVISASSEGREQRHAAKVLNLLKKGKHWVLVTLLLSNVIVNETLPIVLDRSLGGGWPAVLGSTALIVIFGEVIPQSICVRYGLSIGAFMAPAVLALMWILSPIAWPTAKLLDKLLGEDHGTVYKKSGLKTLVTLHKTLGNSPTDRLNQDEVTIISAVLDLKDKAVGHIMTPMEDVFTMCEDEVLDEETMNTILSAGYSRIPIYKADNAMNFVGMLLVKILITYDPEDCKKVSDFALATLPETRPETSCLDIINFFQEGKSHMVLVSEFPGENYGAQGVVTLEDVIEELIGEEIIDESDVYIDVHKAIRRMAPAPKARVYKGHLDRSNRQSLTGPDADLIDLSGETAIDPVKRVVNGDERIHSPSHSHAAFGTSPKTTFLKRHSSGQDSLPPIPVRGNVTEMREHLKHLGPSNLASRPKSTRYQSVKIKPGVLARNESAAESTGYSRSIIDEPYHDDLSAHGGEGEGLLRSAGRDAKDGILALQQGYGSMNYHPTSRVAPPEPPLVAEGAPCQPPAYRKVLREYSPAVLSRNNSDRSSDTLKSLQSVGARPWAKGTARSGSITEHTIESGGFQKVVLQTYSGSDMEEIGESSHSKASRSESSSPTAHSKDSMQADGLETQAEQDDTVKGEEVKKKRRRQRKKKGPKSVNGAMVEEGSTVGEGSTGDSLATG